MTPQEQIYFFKDDKNKELRAFSCPMFGIGTSAVKVEESDGPSKQKGKSKLAMMCPCLPGSMKQHPESGAGFSGSEKKDLFEAITLLKGEMQALRKEVAAGKPSQQDMGGANV